LPAESQHHDEERKSTPRIADGDASVGAPIDLGALAGGEMQLQIDWALRRSDAADVIADDADAAAITFLAQPLKNLLCLYGWVSSKRVMLGLNGSSLLGRGLSRRRVKRARANQVATVLR